MSGRVGARAAGLMVVAGLLMVSAFVVRAQQPQAPETQAPSQPVFRGGVEFVSVDVYPRRDGKFIEGLRAEDFQIFEDGAPQAIERFEFVRIEPNPVDTERRDPSSQADGDRQAADPRNRVFVVYLDLANTTIAGGYQTRQPVVDFLTRTIGARDLFGVMTADTPAAQLVFGRRLETIEDELARHWTWGQAERLAPMPRTPSERRLSECALRYEARTGRDIEPQLLGLHRQDALMSSLENLMARLGGLRDERKNVLFISEGWVPRGPADDLRNATVSEGAVPGVGVGPGGRIGIGQSMQPFSDASSCDTEVARLAGIDFEARFRLLLTSATQANVSFYPVDVGGLRTSAPLGGAVDTLRTLAENTDGFAVVGTNDLTGAVRRIETDLSAFYLLGYYSSNPNNNGRFRRIEVKVSAPGVRVSARRGYFAMTPEMAAAATAPRDTAGPSAVDEALGRLTSVRADADLFVIGAAGPAGLDVAVEVSAAAAKREGWTGGGTLQVLATSADGRTSTAAAELAAGERSARVTLPAADIGAGPWQVLVQAAGRDGRMEQRTEVAAAAARLVGQPLAFRGTSSLRSALRPLADARLSRLERLRVEWPVLGQAETHTARLLDRTGKPLGQPLPFTQLPADRQALAVDLPIGSLPEGDYVVELVASQGEATERRLLAFRVVR
ncbi:MAG: VWA domain-containing protein [Acidobacteria bacterium]|nr:VWA domain-containing protein [Acidobacteriota bacterium]